MPQGWKLLEEWSVSLQTWGAAEMQMEGLQRSPQSRACCRGQNLGWARTIQSFTLGTDWLHLQPSLQGRVGSRRHHCGRAGGPRSLCQLLFYLRSPLLSLRFNSRPSDGEWLPGPQKSIRTRPQGTMSRFWGSCCHLEGSTRWVYLKMKEELQECPAISAIMLLQKFGKGTSGDTCSIC